MRTVVGLVGALLCVSSIAWAQEGQRDSLAGIGEIGLVIEPMDLEAVQDGLTTDALWDTVGARLAAQAIPTSRGVSPPPYLYVSVNAVRDASGLYGYSIDLKLSQVVTVRATGLETVAATWDFGIVGTIAAEQLPEVVAQVGQAVDRFGADYLAANPAP